MYNSPWRKPATFLAAALTVIGSQPIFPQPPASPQPCSPQVNLQSVLPINPSTEDPDVAAINAFIGTTETAAIEAIPAATDTSHQIELLGKLEIYDRSISPAQNIACATCHSANVGFTGGASLNNSTVVAYEGGTSNHERGPAGAQRSNLRPQAPELCLCYLFTRAALQRDAGGFCGRNFSGYASHRNSLE